MIKNNSTFSIHYPGAEAALSNKIPDLANKYRNAMYKAYYFFQPLCDAAKKFSLEKYIKRHFFGTSTPPTSQMADELVYVSKMSFVLGLIIGLSISLGVCIWLINPFHLWQK